MMNLYVMIAIIIANLIAISVVYQFVKRLEKKEKIIFIVLIVALVYISILIVYWFSGFGIDKTIHEQCKNFITYVFVPVNVIIGGPYIAYQYMKLKDKKIKKSVFINKCSGVIALIILVLVGEFFYFRNIQESVKTISSNVNEQNQTNEVIENGNEIE